MEIRRLLQPLDKSDYTRSAIKALIPSRYRQRLRAWLRPDFRSPMVPCGHE